MKVIVFSNFNKFLFIIAEKPFLKSVLFYLEDMLV